METQRLGSLFPHCENGIEGCHGLLEDHGHGSAAQAAHGFFRKPDEFTVLKAHGSRSRGAPWQNSEYGAGREALAASGFAHEAGHGTLLKGKTDVLYGGKRMSVLVLKGDAESLNV